MIGMRTRSEPPATGGGPAGSASPGEDVRPNYVGMGFLLAMVVLGGVYAAMAFGYGLSAETNPMGPGAAPAFLGILLIIGCLVLLTQEVVGYRRARSGAASDDDAGGEFTPRPAARELTRPLLLVVILLGGLLLTPVVGMTVSMAAAVLAIARVIERLGWIPSSIMTAATALMLWGVFEQLLDVRFPENLVGI